MKTILLILLGVGLYFSALFIKNVQVEKSKGKYVPTIYDIQKKEGIPVYVTTVEKGSFREFVTLSGKLDQSGRFSSSVAPQVMRKVRGGDLAYLSINGKPIKGRIASVSGAPNVLTGLFEVSADFNIRPKAVSSITIDVPVTEIKGAILVPREGLNLRGPRPVAFVLDGKEIHPRPVEIAGANGEQYLIKSGLKPGEQIVVSDTRNFSGGEKVKSILVRNEL